MSDELLMLAKKIADLEKRLARTEKMEFGTTASLLEAGFAKTSEGGEVRYIVMCQIAPTTDWSANGTANVGLECSSPIAGTMVSIAANVQTAGTTGTAIVDVNKNGTTIMATNKLKWDSGEKSTRDYSGTAAALSTTALAVGDILSVDIDTNHTTKSKGLTVTIGVRQS